MSYQIYYNKQFVKLSGDRVIPITLDGANNCTFMHKGHEIRERDWNNHDFYIRTNNTGRFFTTADNWISSVKSYMDKEVQESLKSEWYKGQTEEQIKKGYGGMVGLSFGGGGCNGSYDQYLNFHKNGVKQALTIEQLHELGIHLQFRCFTWPTYSFSMPFPEQNLITNEAEFFDQLEKWLHFENNCIITEREYNGDLKEQKPTVYLHYKEHWDYILYHLLKYRRGNKKEKTYQDKTQDHFFVLKNHYGYLFKYTRRSYRYCGDGALDIAKSFKTIKEAQRFSDKHTAENWQIIKIDKPFTYKVAV